MSAWGDAKCWTGGLTPRGRACQTGLPSPSVRGVRVQQLELRLSYTPEGAAARTVTRSLLVGLRAEDALDSVLRHVATCFDTGLDPSRLVCPSARAVFEPFFFLFQTRREGLLFTKFGTRGARLFCCALRDDAAVHERDLCV